MAKRRSKKTTPKKKPTDGPQLPVDLEPRTPIDLERAQTFVKLLLDDKKQMRLFLETALGVKLVPKDEKVLLEAIEYKVCHRNQTFLAELIYYLRIVWFDIARRPKSKDMVDEMEDRKRKAQTEAERKGELRATLRGESPAEEDEEDEEEDAGEAEYDAFEQEWQGAER